MRDDVLATLSQRPSCPLDLWASYMIVRSARRVLWTLLHFCLSSSEALSTGEDTKTRKDPVEFGNSKELQNNEGRTPGMSSAIRIVSPRRDGIFEGELGPYIPASPVKVLSTRLIADEARPFEVVNSAQNGDSGQLRDSVAESARAMGEAHFGDTESVDEWMNPTNG